jgi:hypothetical protein
MRRLWRTLWGILREIADEAPYQRHLESSKQCHSPAEWRRFADERMKRKYSRPKCC